MKQKFVQHLLALLAAIVIYSVYFMPAYEGKVLQSSDNIQAQAMQHERIAHQEATGKEALWTNNLFSGMPTFMMGIYYNNPGIIYLTMPIEKLFKSPVSFGIYYFIGFYFLLIVLGFSPWIAAMGAMIFSLGTYNFVIIEAGHYTKARCIGLMPFILGGLIMMFNKKYLVGAAITAFFVYFQIRSNHPQITYYMMLMIGFYFLYQLYNSFKTKEIKNFAIVTALFIGSVGLGVAANYTQLWVTYEYTKDTMRGGSELASTTTANNNGKNKSGLDKNYAFMWSYGKMESFTLLIPDLYGGSSGGKLDEKSKVYETLTIQGVSSDQAIGFANQMPTYWGPKVQESSSATTSGPVYIGSIICFLFLLGIFIIKEQYRWWIFGASILALFMSWGKFLGGFNNLLFDYLPMYNKFRTVEMSLVLLEVTIPLFAFLAIKKIYDEKISKDELLKALKISSIIMGAILLIFALMPSLVLNFDGGKMDEYLRSNLMNNGKDFADRILSALKSDRESMAKADAWRSLLFIAIAAGSIWAYATNKIKANIMVIIICAASIVDLWSLDKRYLNNDNFKEDTGEANYVESAADQQVLHDKTLSFRIFNYNNPFNDAIPSYHHKNIGGYNPAKLARYQDVIDSCISKNNMNVINMLNTKYFMGKAQNGQEVAQLNPMAMGNAWFVDTIITANSPREEIVALNKINTRTTAVLDISKFKNAIPNNILEKDSTAKIQLTKNDLDALEYTVNASKPQVAVFSEVYYADEKGKGWQAYLDGNAVPHFRVNYILRAMNIPAGNHKIEFKFEPKQFFEGQKISMIGSILLMILILAAIGFEIFNSGLIKKNK
jgi:hypothetical protein